MFLNIKLSVYGTMISLVASVHAQQITAGHLDLTAVTMQAVKPTPHRMPYLTIVALTDDGILFVGRDGMAVQALQQAVEVAFHSIGGRSEGTEFLKRPLFPASPASGFSLFGWGIFFRGGGCGHLTGDCVYGALLSTSLDGCGKNRLLRFGKKEGTSGTPLQRNILLQIFLKVLSLFRGGRI